MPYVTGEQLANKIMKLKSDIPIILCTGFSEAINENKAKRLGIKAFLSKPISSKELAHTIQDVLNNK